jgi:sugar phosphate permease
LDRNQLQTETATAPTNVRWSVFTMGCLTSWMLYVHRYTFGVLKPDIAEAYGLDNASLGYLDALFSVFYGGVQIPAGMLVDVVGADLFLTASIVTWSVGLALHAGAPAIGCLYAGRMLLGAGQSAVFASLGWLTKQWFHESVRTTIQGWLGVFFARFGGAATNILVATVMIGILGYGWQTVLIMLASSGLVLAGLFLIIVRNSPELHPRANQAEIDLVGMPDTTAESAEDKTRPSFMEMLRNCPKSVRVHVLLLCFAASFSTVADHIFSGWIPMFLKNAHGLSYKEMGIYSSLPLIGGAIGGVLGGFLNDKLTARLGRRQARRIMGATGKGMAAVMLFIALFVKEDPYLFCILLGVVKIFADISLATRWGAITDMGGRFTATLFAFVNSFAIVIGIVGSIVQGYMIPNDANNVAGWLPVLVLGFVCYCLCAICWAFVDCTKQLSVAK